MAEEYLRNGAFREWYKPVKRNTMGQPPTEAMVEQAVEEFSTFWDAIATLPSMRSIEPWDLLPQDIRDRTPQREARDVAEMRRFPTDEKPGEAHMLFRPLGQQALAMAVGVLVNDPQQPMALDKIFEVLARYDERGGFCLTDKRNPWWGVLYDQRKVKIVSSGATLAANLLEYMLSGQVGRGIDNLRLAFISARKSSTEGMYVDLNGDDVAQESITLPPLLH